MMTLLLLVVPPIAAPGWPVLGVVFGLCVLGAVYFGAGLLRGKK